MHSEYKTGFSFKRYCLAVLLLVVFLIITISLYLIVKEKRRAFQEAIFESRSQLAEDAIQQRIEDYFLILRGSRALFSSSDTVTRAEWDNYISAIQIGSHYPGARGIGQACIIPEYNTQKFIRKVQNNINGAFKIWPNSNNKLKAPITYYSTLSSDSKNIIGFDVMSEQRRKSAIENCIINNRPTVSSIITLVTEPDTLKQPGFAIFLPIYRNNTSIEDQEDRQKNIRGLIFSPFRSYDFVHSILKKDFTDLEIEIYDNTIAKGNLLFASHKGNSQINQKNDFIAEKTLELNGSKWIIIFKSMQRTISPADRNFPMIILLTGTVISILIFLIALSVLHNKHKSDVANKIIQNQNLQLTKINNELDNFVYTASHDLKSPINNLEGLMQMINDEVKTSNNSELPPLIKMMNESVQKLKNTIVELTDIGRIQKETEEKYEEINIKELIEEVLFNYKQTIKETDAKIELNFQKETLKFSKKNMRSMMDNLISNALKYHSHDRTPDIQLCSYERNGQVHFSIKDNGLGIPEDQLEIIFEMFKRAHTHVPGSGVGLYLVKRIMDNSGGKVIVKSEEDVGSEFILIFKCVQ